MFSKLEITGTITVITGMHIGASDGFAAIGAIDSPVAKDPLSRKPYIPGSTLKGKMRSLLAKSYNEYAPKTRDGDNELIKRLFGQSNSSSNDKPGNSRVIFSDTVLSNEKQLKDRGAQSTCEAKEENTISPLTAIANPRQIERVIRGAEFPLSIIYNVDNQEDVEEDFGLIAEGLQLLQYDYIGGHGSRGYGKIAISDINVDCAIGEMDDSVLEKCNSLLKKVENSAISKKDAII